MQFFVNNTDAKYLTKQPDIKWSLVVVVVVHTLSIPGIQFRVEKWFAFDNVLYNKYHTEMLLSLCVSKVFYIKK